MINYDNEADSTPPNFELMHDAVEPVYKELATYTKAHGNRAMLNDMYPLQPGDERPAAYVAQIDSLVVQGIFHPDDDSLIAEAGSDITYSEPHRLYSVEVQPDGAVREDISIVLKWRLKDSGLGLYEYYGLTKRDGVITATLMPEYCNPDGSRISPNNLESGRELGIEEVIESIDDHFVLERPMTLDDLEKLHQLIDVLNG